MKIIITMILLLIAGQAYAGEQLIDVQHDSARGVTCWIVNNTGISCLPDSSFQHQQAGRLIEQPRAGPLRLVRHLQKRAFAGHPNPR